MLNYLTADQLAAYPVLRDIMHRDRIAQFRGWLKWDVTVDADGFKRDEYDAMNPLYVIWEMPSGRHGGSMRFEKILECTRWCSWQGAGTQGAAALMWAGGELMRAFDLTHLLGVFDARMVRIYNMIGASPDVLGSSGTGREKISVGLWASRSGDRTTVLRRAGVSSAVSEHWFERSFGHKVIRSKAA